MLPVDIDDFFVDLYYYFEKSTKRKEIYREFTDTKELKIIKHVQTCWLSLYKVVKRVINQWEPPNAYFDREAETDHSTGVQRLNSHLNRYLTK